jgi:hypothetical protein
MCRLQKCAKYLMIDGGPLVSVVVPAFNAAETIHETLHSISQQTYRALEVIFRVSMFLTLFCAIANRTSSTPT